MGGTKETVSAARGKKSGNGESTLMISRNKHWRYISCYHGPWLQLPPEVLQNLAMENFYMPRPRLIHAGTFFDIVKIRTAVDEAAEDATRASIGTTNPGGTAQNQYDLWGSSGQPPGKMSKERIFRVRQKAAKLLARAYMADEVACSVVAMQSSTAIDHIGEHVLKRDRGDVDAKYVHFFHEKVPSRAMEQNTSLDPLTEVTMQASLEMQASALRTRGIVRVFKHDLDNAVLDFTTALRLVQELSLRHSSSSDQLVLASEYKLNREKWLADPKTRPHIRDEDQPQGLESQLLFHRAGVYLELACESVASAVDGLTLPAEKRGTCEAGSPSPLELKQGQRRLLARKKVKANARKAWKDYMAFLSHLDYSPAATISGYGQDVEKQSTGPRRICMPPEGSRDDANAAVSDSMVPMARTERRYAGSAEDAVMIHPASALFSEKPIPDLSWPLASENTGNVLPHLGEAVTYHPLLVDALHSLLLCHCLMQTSPTELHRHAQSVARLVRVADGYPLFQVPRSPSPSRSDWVEVLRYTDNLIKLDMSWSQLCSPSNGKKQSFETAHAWPTARTEQTKRSQSQSQQHPKPLVSGVETTTASVKAERIKQQAVYAALGDESVVDPASFQRSVAQREKQARQDDATDKRIFTPSPIGTPKRATAADTTPSCGGGKVDMPASNTDAETASSRSPAAERNVPVSDNARARLIARWVTEAPKHVAGGTGTAAGGGKRRRRPKRNGAALDPASEGPVGGVGGLGIHDVDGEATEGAHRGSS